MRKIRIVVVGLVAVTVLGACNLLALPGNTASITLVSTSHDRRLEVRLLPQHRVPVQRQRLPDVRHRHEGRFVDDRGPRRCGCSCTAAAPATSTPPGNPIPGPGPEGRGEPRRRCTTHLTNNGSPREGPRRRRRASARSRCRTAATTSTRAPTRPTRTTRTRRPTASPARRTACYATKAAIQYAQSHYPTTKTFLHGGERRIGRHVRRRVGDAAPGHRARGCRRRREHRQRRGVRGRLRRRATAPTTTTRPASPRSRRGCTPTSRTSTTSPTSSSSSGRLTVPILHIWNHGDIEHVRLAADQRARCATGRTSRWGSPTASTSRCGARSPR